MGAALGLDSTRIGDRITANTSLQNIQDGARLSFTRPGLVEETPKTKNLVIENYDAAKICQELKTLDPEWSTTMCRMLQTPAVADAPSRNFKNICFVNKNAQCLVKVINNSANYDGSVLTLRVDWFSIRGG